MGGVYGRLLIICAATFAIYWELFDNARASTTDEVTNSTSVSCRNVLFVKGTFASLRDD